MVRPSLKVSKVTHFGGFFGLFCKLKYIAREAAARWVRASSGSADSTMTKSPGKPTCSRPSQAEEILHWKDYRGGRMAATPNVRFGWKADNKCSLP